MPSRQRQKCGYQGRKQSLRQDACPWFTIAYPKLAICPNQRRPFSVPVSKDGRIEQFLTETVVDEVGALDVPEAYVSDEQRGN